MPRKYMRRKRRKRMMRRRYRRYRKYPKREVKITDINLLNSTVYTENRGVPTYNLTSSYIFGTSSSSGLLSAIGQGSGSNQRIGNKIFVKAIAVHMTVWLCPASDDTGTYDTVTLRVLSSGIDSSYLGNDVNNYWSNYLTTHVHDYPRRSNYKTYLDKTVTLLANNPISGATRAGKGVMRTFKWQLNFRNRTVEFKDFNTQPKYLEDRINMVAMAFSPSVADLKQLVCYNANIRIYYTDP